MKKNLNRCGWQPVSKTVIQAPSDNKALNEKYLHKKFFSFLRMKGVCIKGPLKRSDSDGTVSLLQTPAMKRKQPAFSLVELLMALLVASLLMAALAPVMTKKFGENVIVSGTGNNILPTGGCIVTEGLQEDFCEVPQNTYSINAIIASGGGGGSGAAMGSYSSEKPQAAISANAGSESQNTRSYTITKDMRNVTIQLIGGGGGAGAGWSNEGGYPANQADCGDWGVFIGTDYSPTYSDVGIKHSICVSRRNPEINGGGAAPKINISGVILKTADTTNNVCPAASAGNCCWTGHTAASGDDGCNTSNGTYSGCNRSVCGWTAANSVCNSWNPASSNGGSMGRLPSHLEMILWAEGIKYNQTISGNTGILDKYNSNYQPNYPGLQHCNSNPGLGATVCKNGKGCETIDGSNKTCYPHAIWGKEKVTGSNNYYDFFLSDGGIFYENSNPKDIARGVRCVVDKISAFSTYTGGGGGSGLYMKIKIPDDVIRKATKNGRNARLELSAGGGGKGGATGDYTNSNTGHPGMDGKPSRAELYDENGQSVWAIQVPGGKTGYSARKNSNGSAGAAINREATDTVNACRYFNQYSKDNSAKTEKTTACNNIPDSGVVLDIQGGNAGNGGNGGRGFFDGSSPAAAGPSAGISGSDGTRGGGGGGGQCTIGETRLAPKCATGGNGGGGMAKLTYQYYYPGVGGSGGGAGALVHIKNISNGIKPGVKITMNAGAGGAGGAAGSIGGNGSEGLDGNSSYISYSTNGTNLFKFEAAGGGGAKGAMAGKPDENTLPAPGNAGQKSNINTTKLNSLVGRHNYKFYPSDLAKTAGKKAEFTGDYTISAGANGGINSKISPITSKPCGGLSNQPIDYYGAKDISEESLVCDLVTTNALNPVKLSREDIPGAFTPNMAAILSDENEAKYAGEVLPGATGGGGGSWSWPEDGEEQATAGEKGLDGYVIIYWNLQQE